MKRIVTMLQCLVLACLGEVIHHPAQAWVLRGEFAFQGKAPEAALVYLQKITTFLRASHH